MVIDKKKSGQDMGLLIGVVLLVIAIFPAFSSQPIKSLFIYLALVFLLFALLLPRILYPLHFIWMKFAHLLSAIMTPLVMGIIFFGIITPVGLLLRLRNKDILRIGKHNRQAETYWKDKDKSLVFNMKKQF